MRYTGTPHLVVEVLSTDRSADLVRKFGKYAQAGVPRYWVIDPEGPELFAFELSTEGGLRAAGHFTANDVANLDMVCRRIG